MKFKRMITEETTHFVEWRIYRRVTVTRIDCSNASPFDTLGNILVFSKNSKDEMFVAIVKEYNINFYI